VKVALPSLHQPRLRPLDAQPLSYEGMTYLHLRDPLQLSKKTVIVPQPLIPLLPLLDGTRTLLQLQLALSLHHKVRVGMQHLEDLVTALDSAFLLDNQQYHLQRDLALKEYLNVPSRSPALAGNSYPESADELHNLLDTFMGQTHEQSRTARGLISPHIDYPRGGPVYAKIWQAVRSDVQNADLAILLGTDHFSEGNPITLTRQNYATPWGTLPTDQDWVNAVAEAIEATAAFAGELHHRTEHSLELAAVWLHYIRGGQPLRILPILCGPFDSFEDDTGSLRSSPVLSSVIEILQMACSNSSTVVIAAADFSHVGPAFGGDPVSPAQKSHLEQDDTALISAITQGDADGFYHLIRKSGDRNNVCGTTSIYTALRVLEPVQGQVLAYDICPADTAQSSFVSIAGILLS
jgi:MEMO1 family protein